MKQGTFDRLAAGLGDYLGGGLLERGAMTDRELLEFAAKACGYDISHPWNALRRAMNPPVAALCIDGVSTAWNPLVDDGAAMRLAVKLGMDLKTDTAVSECIDGIYANGALASAYVDFKWHEGEEANGNDPYAATRRAIVRAAAEIGKALP